jgi:hypothetical protein
VVRYSGCTMEKADTERVHEVRRWSAGNAEWAENGKKMLFRGNELKDLLETKELAFLGAQNELVFERQKPPAQPEIWPRIHLLHGNPSEAVKESIALTTETQRKASLFSVLCASVSLWLEVCSVISSHLLSFGRRRGRPFVPARRRAPTRGAPTSIAAVALR